jgi:uncharacterized protein YjbI with pentapeptide repeats
VNLTIELAGQAIANTRLIGASREYSGIRLTDSTLTGCVLAQFDDPELTLKVRRVVVERCRIDRCSSQGVFFEDVTVDTLSMAQLHRLHGCVFKHVTLRGKIGPVMAMGPHTSLANRPDHVAGIIEKYKGVDWALDISEAIFSDADFYYVPGELIRRDESSQFLLRRESFADIDWRDLPGYASIWASRFDETPFDSIIAIAPKGSRDLGKYMADAEWLRNQGLVD